MVFYIWLSYIVTKAFVMPPGSIEK